jgi:hypothetical protein
VHATARLAMLLSALALDACGGAGAGGAGAGGMGGAGAGGRGGGGGACPSPPDFTAAAPTCNTAPNGAGAVPFTAVTGTPPAPGGGVIVDGVYRSVRAEGYGSVAAAGRRITIVVVGNGTQMLWTGEVLDATATTTTLSFAANAAVTPAAGTSTRIQLDTTCSSAATSPLPAALDFTATPSQMVLSLSSSAGTSVTTYQRSGCP